MYRSDDSAVVWHDLAFAISWICDDSGVNIGEALISLSNFCAVRCGLNAVLEAKARGNGEAEQFAALASLLGEGEANGLQEAIERIAAFCVKSLGEKRAVEISGGNPFCLAGALRLAAHLGGVAGVAVGAMPGSFTPSPTSKEAGAPRAPATQQKPPTPFVDQQGPPAPSRDEKLERLKMLAVAVFSLREIANLMTMVPSAEEKYRTLEHLFHLNNLTFAGMRPDEELSRELVRPDVLDAREEKLRAERQSSIDSICAKWPAEP